MGTKDSVKAGQVAITAGGTAQQMPMVGGSTGGVRIKAHSGNTGMIYLGSDDTVDDETGYELDAGESLDLEVLNLGRLWIMGDTTADRLSWVSVNA